MSYWILSLRTHHIVLIMAFVHYITRIKHFRGTTVAVREFTSTNTPINEAKTILAIPSHPCLPLLIGLCCERQPYLLVCKLYGSHNCGVMLCITAALEESMKSKDAPFDWMSILYDIAQGLHHTHTNGFVHGNLQPFNIVLHKRSRYIYGKQIVIWR